jgi:spermidine/putrescine transport system permease protein
MSAVTTTSQRAPIATTQAPEYKPKKHLTRFILPTFTWLMIVYLTLPIIVMIVYSFNAVPAIEPIRQTPKFQGFTLQWWKDPFSVSGLTSALKNSLTIAPIASIIATILGTLLGLALGRYRFRGKAPTNFIIFLAIAVPEIVFGSSLLSLFILLGFIKIGYVTILISHIAFSIPFVAVVVRARVQGLDHSLEDAAQDLFADPITAFFKVTFPLILPGIVSGFLLAFVLSLDDFVITNFVAGPVQTFPIWVFGATRLGLPPQVNVMGTLLFAAGVLAAVINVLVQRRRART